jgi:hypothetical protein
MSIADAIKLLRDSGTGESLLTVLNQVVEQIEIETDESDV